MPMIRRLIAPNPGAWTGEGTNTWLIEAGAPVLIDPGPDEPRHLAAIEAALGGRPLAAILVTHAHRDHSALAPRLSARTGAAIWAAADPHGGRRLPDLGLAEGEGVDTAFRPDHPLHHGQELRFGEVTLRALHTPGHLGGHFCLALGERLFSGDHVMGWSTTIVTPPEGDMAAYRAALEDLARESWSVLLPGHGPAITAPAARLAELIAHRATREAQILAALAPGPATPQEIAARLYADLSPALIAAAAGNVLAHLLQLQGEGRVQALDTPAQSLAFCRFGLGSRA